MKKKKQSAIEIGPLNRDRVPVQGAASTGSDVFVRTETGSTAFSTSNLKYSGRRHRKHLSGN